MVSRNLKILLSRWPGEKTFGVYRFLPIFFGIGAGLEFSMINWRVGETNFYSTFKRRRAQDLAKAKLGIDQ